VSGLCKFLPGGNSTPSAGPVTLVSATLGHADLDELGVGAPQDGATGYAEPVTGLHRKST
jgi:hypothetical protein